MSVRCLKFRILGIALALLAACASPAENPALLTPPIPPIPPEPLPDFLPEVFPEPGAILSLDEYNDPTWRPGRPLAEEAPGAVCVQVDGSALFEEGDFWEFADVNERTTILVDGQAGGEIVSFASLLLSYKRMDPPDNPFGKVLASVGGPYHWCISAPLIVGIHRVDVSFEKSSGEVVPFAWTFELVND